MAKNTTIYEIAKEVGIHPSTVSRALNGKDGVRADLMAKILQVAESKNYHPGNFSRPRRLDCADIGVYVKHTSNPKSVGQSYYSVLDGIRRELQDNGYNVMLKELPDDQTNADCADCVTETNMAGAIIVGRTEAKMVECLKSANIPHVLVDWELNGLNVDCVMSDSFGGALKSTDYLLDKGHSHISFVYALVYHPSIAARLDGYGTAMSRRGLPIVSVEADHLNIESGVSAVKQILSSEIRPTALVLANDELAIGVMHGLQERGLKIPDDMAIVGFDDIPWSAYTRPSLTTVRVDFDLMGRRAVWQLISQCRYKNYIPAISMMPTSLIIRESAG